MGNSYCPACKKAKFDAVNAEALEKKQKQGLKKAQARAAVRAANRPLCRVCGKGIVGGKAGVTFFCRKTDECKKASQIQRFLQRKYPDQPIETRVEAVLLALKTKKPPEIALMYAKAGEM